jgi:glutathione synthase/RimK-type ligase-like ATP-grasp enzyme
MAVVGVLASAGDPQAERVTALLRQGGHEVFQVDTGAFPNRATLTLREGVVHYNGDPLPQPEAVYVRGLAVHPLIPRFNEAFEAGPRQMVATLDEKRGLLEALIRTWEAGGTRIVNTLEANAQHSHKPFQLHLLQSAGVPVPRWIAGNDPQAVREFVDEVVDVIYKPISGGATAEALQQEDLSEDRLAALALAPVLFQARVEGETCRLYVAGDRVVAAAAIHSDALDYRTGEAEITPLTPHELEADLCIRAAQTCDMPFSGVDLIRGPEGPVILECNPSPMFAVFEDRTGQDIAGPLARLLAGD